MDIIAIDNRIKIENLESRCYLLEKRCAILEEKYTKLKNELDAVNPKTRKKNKLKEEK